MPASIHGFQRQCPHPMPPVTMLLRPRRRRWPAARPHGVHAVHARHAGHSGHRRHAWHAGHPWHRRHAHGWVHAHRHHRHAGHAHHPTEGWHRNRAGVQAVRQGHELSRRIPVLGQVPTQGNCLLMRGQRPELAGGGLIKVVLIDIFVNRLWCCSHHGAAPCSPSVTALAPLILPLQLSHACNDHLGRVLHVSSEGSRNQFALARRTHGADLQSCFLVDAIVLEKLLNLFDNHRLLLLHRAPSA
mmetsp:Transcript_91208/g.229284  ORF Transcript_91208/g.229284 Transcript_91208/m.229284 type:complete len:244 (+) Transcript_91208:64-795(+)